MSEGVYETSDADYSYFQKRFQHWAGFYGLHEWKIYFKHEDIENAYAYICISAIGRCCTVYLAINWPQKPLKEKLDESAFHEATHLLLGKIDILSRDRYISEDQINNEIHGIVRILERVILKNVNKQH